MIGADLRFSSCVLAVHALDEAVAFYRDVLGFDVHDEGERRVSVRPRAQPEVRIFLEAPRTSRAVEPRSLRQPAAVRPAA